jgi:hypothetical protein
MRYLNAHQPSEAPCWTQERLLRSMRRLVGEGLADASLLVPVAPKAAPDRLLAVIVLLEPKATLRAIGRGWSRCVTARPAAAPGGRVGRSRM